MDDAVVASTRCTGISRRPVLNVSSGFGPSDSLDLARSSLRERIVGASCGTRAVLRDILQVARTDATVLLLGETGTGKELFARAVHELSPRAMRPLVRVDCASLTPSLCESELYGHVRGAFTGASERRVGRIELARGGTLFLDELGELPIELQPKLLRVLQEGEFEPVGSNRTLNANMRVVAASNRALADEVAAGRFRADLYYRIAGFVIRVSPLRERLCEIDNLVAHFLEKQSNKLRRVFDPPSSAVLAHLAAHSWPGNVRELQFAVERACIAARGRTLTIGDFRLSPGYSRARNLAAQGGASVTTTAIAPTLREVERQHILNVLELCHGVVDGKSGAASVLGVPPSTARFRIRKHGIVPRRAVRA